MPRQDIDGLLAALTQGFESRNAGRRFPDATLEGTSSNVAFLRTTDTGVSVQPDATTNEATTRQTLIEELNRLNRQVEQLRSVEQTGMELTQQNTEALAQNTSVKTADGESSVKSVGRGLASLFTSGFGFAPLIGGLISLFKNKPEETQAPLTAYVRPAPLRIERAVGGSGLQTFDYDQSGMARVTPAINTVTTAPQVTVNVQTIDSQSFLDHRGEIAKAVREALLESQRLADVLAEF